ncbi:colicin immunity domain-containing protein [Psychrobacter celer]|uniref:colicin immunity domain-containing protein n=1 Tax=Psychrobacter celer TaxID=306572 RepID=UPI003FD250CD
MSISLLKFTESFLQGRIDAEVFTNAYIEFFRIERDINVTSSDSPNLNEVLSSIFSIADLYNPEDDREEYEFDEKNLRKYIELELEKIMN